MQRMKMPAMKDITHLAAINAQRSLASKNLTDQIDGKGKMSQNQLDRQLHNAVKSGTYADVELALKAKADPNSRIDGWTPLGRSKWSGRKDITQLLVQYGATEMEQIGALGKNAKYGD